MLVDNEPSVLLLPYPNLCTFSLCLATTKKPYNIARQHSKGRSFCSKILSDIYRIFSVYGSVTKGYAASPAAGEGGSVGGSRAKKKARSSARGFFFFYFLFNALLGGVAGRAPPRPPAVIPPYVYRCFFSAGFSIWNEHMSVSSTLIIAPALSNSPQ